MSADGVIKVTWRRWFQRGCISGLLMLLLLARPAQAQQASGITSPASGDVVSGVVVIRGTAAGGNFLRYEVAFNNGSDWIVFAEGDQPVVDGTLAIWDTTVGSPGNPIYPDGGYQLRLRVVRQDFNYAEYFVPNITVANGAAVPSIEATPTEEPAGAATPAPPAVETNTPPAAGDFALPTSIPTLTPFPTPSPAATARVIAGAGSGQPDDPGAGTETSAGLLAQLQAIDASRFSQAFWQGVRVVIYLFAALGLYLILRAGWRWLWRRMR